MKRQFLTRAWRCGPATGCCCAVMGLTDLVQDSEIRSTLDKHLPSNPDRANQAAPANGQALESSVQELIDLANQRSGHDNITHCGQRRWGPSQRLSRSAALVHAARRLAAVGCLGLAVFGRIIGMVVLGPALAGRPAGRHTRCGADLPHWQDDHPRGALHTGNARSTGFNPHLRPGRRLPF